MKLQADYNHYLTEAATDIDLTSRNFYEIVAITSIEDAKNWKEINKEEYDAYQAQLHVANFNPSFEYLRDLKNASKVTVNKINEILLTNKESIEVKDLFPKWTVAIDVKKGNKYNYLDKLYKCLQAHTTQADWTPDKTKSMWGLVSEHNGTKDDPISYEHWMLIEKDVYYSENGKLYIGILDAPNGYDADLSILGTLATEVVE